MWWTSWQKTELLWKSTKKACLVMNIYVLKTFYFRTSFQFVVVVCQNSVWTRWTWWFGWSRFFCVKKKGNTLIKNTSLWIEEATVWKYCKSEKGLILRCEINDTQLILFLHLSTLTRCVNIIMILKISYIILFNQYIFINELNCFLFWFILIFHSIMDGSNFNNNIFKVSDVGIR